MYCPKCGTENLETASFCRKCGTDLRLVPQAITGTLPDARSEAYEHVADNFKRHRKRRKQQSSVAGGVKNIFMGLGFLFVALALNRYGQGWWMWMLIPAFGMIGGGIAELLNAKHQEKKPMLDARPAHSADEVQPAPRASALPPQDTSELVQPPSVTERTTQLLGSELASAEAQTRHIGAEAEKHGPNN